MNKYYIREQRHVCGITEKQAIYQEVDLFLVTDRQHKASGRAKKKLASSFAQEKANRKKQRRYFTQLAHTNFTENDRITHFTYANDFLPKTEQEALHNLDLFLERINYALKKKNLPTAKYMAVTEGRGKQKVRFHHHMIISCKLSDKEIRELWSTGRGKNKKRLGSAKIDELDFEGFGGTIIQLCNYLTKEEVPQGKRSWKQSQGLKKPKRPRPNDSKYTRAKLAKICKEQIDDYDFWRRQYPNWELVEPAQASYNDYTGWSLYAKMKKVNKRNWKKQVSKK